jgi:hypothetical protein
LRLKKAVYVRSSSIYFLFLQKQETLLPLEKN